MFAVVGLGNPGAKYEKTRHNVGHMVINELAARTGSRLAAHSSRTHAASLRIGARPGELGEQVIIATCDSYMNTSGGPVGGLLKYFKIDPSHLIVIHDDLDLPFESIKTKIGGGEGGHNGLKSISQSLSTRDYIRLRVGIGRPTNGQNPADYVLAPFAKSEQKTLSDIISRAAQSVEYLLTMDFSAAQMKIHSQNTHSHA